MDPSGHRDVGAQGLTHAGGVVFRPRAGGAELLLVTARKRPEHWVLPKGHIEAGESPEQAATREVEEEAGVVAEIVRFLGDVEPAGTRSRQRIRFYLMRALEEEAPREGRRSVWLPPERAALTATFDWARQLLRAAGQQPELAATPRTFTRRP